VLYRLPELLKAVKNKAPVAVVEGEKDADKLAGIGFVATTNAGGAGKRAKQYSETLVEVDVMVLPDNDGAGGRHAGQVDYSEGDSNDRQKTRENAEVSEPRGTDSGALADAGDLETIAAALRGLSPEERAWLAAMLIGGWVHFTFVTAYP
jgi:hypothetical protein